MFAALAENANCTTAHAIVADVLKNLQGAILHYHLVSYKAGPSLKSGLASTIIQDRKGIHEQANV